MSDNPLSARGMALEDLFFAHEEAAVRRQAGASQDADKRREDFAEASGITDAAFLGRLADLGIGPDTLAALMLVPVVVVAWADGDVDDEERGSVLSAATDSGLEEGGTGYRLLQRWLATRPPEELFEAWKDYVQALSTSMPVEPMQSLRSEVLKRVRGTAEATGSFLGFGRALSTAEEIVIAEVRNALTD
ncbi:hypothetical protein IPV08_18395 [Methylobacterium sp. SD274]|uniref:hypothetical protein n=1 Tax=unclassified Methylobacterium TaxID=2615210 RepID=UPI001A95BFFE|nr:hypothetical protein [Methylobacterium sp. SD274]MBO1021927.1 hypothetical protein [Methylobacterium sp. SD274]